jgi:hypothetical protein
MFSDSYKILPLFRCKMPLFRYKCINFAAKVLIGMNRKIVEKIKKLRTAKGLNQTEMAE